ncbi:uncharacterized protein LTR77_001752 [Saxophila tyrrhenica]|uniref:Uncharacterized protein n=1 Tax=Saxophila tyrrhenica TaxID=1690608 RepID=A0AAV9PL43_9PEZI|nr:hypothetical protein LTR77_001752 [Saxophila tyrrhenica]
MANTGTYADIGGIGVYASYITQVAIVLAAWLYSNALLFFTRRSTSRKLGQDSDQEHDQQTNRRARKAKLQYSALVHGLVEYQKAQCYFTITLQGASMLALSGDGTIFEAVTYSQIDSAISLLGDVAATAVVCLTFGLYILHKARRRSEYVTTTTLVATIFALVTWILTRTKLGNLQPRALPNTNLPSCGGRATPLRFCHTDRSVVLPTMIEAPLIACCLSLLLFLVGKQVTKPISKLYARYTQTTQKPSNDQHRLPARSSTLNRQSSFYPALTKALSYYHYAAEIIVVLAAIIMLIRLINPDYLNMIWFLNSKPTVFHDLQDSQWSFGQIIAVTIWAPPLIEYVRCAIKGVDEANEHRFVAPYRVVKVNTGLSSGTSQEPS